MVPVPAFAISSVGTLVRQARLGLAGFSPEQLELLTYGRGLDTSRMRSVLGFEPRYTTEQALTEFSTSLPRPLVTHPVLALDHLVSGAPGGTHG
jgi:UDP-glucose 4-epimerase